MRKRKHTIFTLLAAAMLICSTAGTSLAAWQAAGDSVHVIDLAGVKARIAEEYSGADSVYPGNTIGKVVNVKNMGDADCVVRVKVEKAWGELRDGDGKLIVNSALPTGNILIEYDTAHWHYDQSDGYFYYKGVLKPGETTLAPLFKEFTVSKDTGNEYAGLTADIVIQMECVQAAGGGISMWNKTFEALGIQYTPAAPPETVTSVTFAEGEFAFSPVNTDLFANFKQLLPGEVRSQRIEVSNTSGQPVEIFLRAEEMQQVSDNPETLALINKLLREHAVIIVTDEDGTVIYKGPVWGEPHRDGAKPNTMRYDISLGLFAPGKVKRLNVQLSLDPNLGDEYQNLLGRIQWVWSARGDSPETPAIPAIPAAPATPSTPSVPKTGDTSSLLLWAGMMAASAVLFVLTLAWGRKSKRKQTI